MSSMSGSSASRSPSAASIRRGLIHPATVIDRTAMTALLARMDAVFSA